MPVALTIVAYRFWNGSFDEDSLPLALIPVLFVPLLGLLLWILYLPVKLILATPAAKTGNRLVNSTLRNFAFGQDGADKLDTVSTAPHLIPATDFCISGHWHEIMLEEAQKAIKRVVDHNHSLFFRTDLSSALKDIFGRASSENLFQGLIHTSYFQCPELLEAVHDFQAKASNQAALASPLGDQPIAAASE